MWVNTFLKENFARTCLYLTVMLEHVAQRKRGVNIPAELAWLFPDYPFPCMLNTHGSVFFPLKCYFAFFNQEKLHTEYLT